MEFAAVTSCGTKYHTKSVHGTNNRAEWLGFLFAVTVARDMRLQSVTIKGDSKLVIEQSNGRWKINDPHIKVYYQQFLDLKKQIPNLKVEWIGRKDNLAGIFIEEMNK
jgi:ribonuclease HI